MGGAKSTGPPAGAPRVVASGAGNAVANKQLEGKVSGLEGQLQELKLQNDTLEKERLFYFDKLREIEFLLQARQVEQQQSNNLGQDILKILYASEDEKVTIDNEGKLTITAPDGTISATGGAAEPQPQPEAAAAEQIEEDPEADAEMDGPTE